jgi:hypothetical protein
MISPLKCVQILWGSSTMSFPDVPMCLNSSEYDLDTSFFLPCLQWAIQYDCGVGYFISVKNFTYMDTTIRENSPNTKNEERFGNDG